MKEVRLYQWRVLERGRWYRTRHKMTDDEAAQRHPDGAVRIDETVEVRMLPETQQERDRMARGLQHGTALVNGVARGLLDENVRAVGAKDYDTLCDDLFAPELLRGLETASRDFH